MKTTALEGKLTFGDPLLDSGVDLTPAPLPSENRTVISIQEQLLRSDEKQFRGGLVFKARRLVVSLNSRPRVMKKKKESIDNNNP